MIFGAKIMQKIETSKCCECFLTLFNISQFYSDKNYGDKISITLVIMINNYFCDGTRNDVTFIFTFTAHDELVCGVWSD